MAGKETLVLLLPSQSRSPDGQLGAGRIIGTAFCADKSRHILTSGSDNGARPRVGRGVGCEEADNTVSERGPTRHVVRGGKGPMVRLKDVILCKEAQSLRCICAIMTQADG